MVTAGGASYTGVLKEAPGCEPCLIISSNSFYSSAIRPPSVVSAFFSCPSGVAWQFRSRSVRGYSIHPLSLSSLSLSSFAVHQRVFFSYQMTLVWIVLMSMRKDKKRHCYSSSLCSLFLKALLSCNIRASLSAGNYWYPAPPSSSVFGLCVGPESLRGADHQVFKLLDIKPPI